MLVIIFWLFFYSVLRLVNEVRFLLLIYILYSPNQMESAYISTHLIIPSILSTHYLCRILSTPSFVNL